MINLFSKSKSKKQTDLILPIPKQIKAWRRANRKMAWGIPAVEFNRIEAPPKLTDDDRRDGFIGVILSYGFGDDGCGNVDSVLSGRLAWEYACKRKRDRTWQCEYIDFDKKDHFRLRTGAIHRPKGFYFSKFQPGNKHQVLTVSQLLKMLKGDTGCGPEGIQLLVITHTHFSDMMNARKIPFMAFADYDVAPHGFNDFYDTLQMFCSQGILGMGIGNVDCNYPLFGIPTLRF
jgi:hypothetical protein